MLYIATMFILLSSIGFLTFPLILQTSMCLSGHLYLYIDSLKMNNDQFSVFDSYPSQVEIEMSQRSY